MPQTKLFRIGYAVLLIFLIILVGMKINFLFHPLVILVQTLFFPFLFAGVLYYLFRPVVHLLEKKEIPRTLSIFLIYLGFVGLIILAGALIGPTLSEQVSTLVDRVPTLTIEAQVQLSKLQENPYFTKYFQEEKIEETLAEVTQYLSDSFSSILANIASVIGLITEIVLVFITVPFILFYLLKEGEKAPEKVLQLLPNSKRIEGRKILSDMDEAISSYIQGQVMVSFFVGLLIYIGYLIIGLDYSILLALITMLTNVIPFIGPFIGTLPALIVGLLHPDPWMALKVLIVVVAVQQIEGNLISPQIMGRTLNVHPLTIILLLLVAGSLGGFLGLLLAVPTYALLKVIVSHTYRLVRLRYLKWQRETDD